MRNMRMLITAGILSIAVSGCAMLQDIGGKIEVAAPQIEAVASEVATATRRICGFEPIAASLIGIIGGPAVSGPLEVANLLCDAVKAKPLAAASGKRKIPVAVVVRGVRVEGHIVRKKGR